MRDEMLSFWRFFSWRHWGDDCFCKTEMRSAAVFFGISDEK